MKRAVFEKSARARILCWRDRYDRPRKVSPENCRNFLSSGSGSRGACCVVRGVASRESAALPYLFSRRQLIRAAVARCSVAWRGPAWTKTKQSRSGICGGGPTARLISEYCAARGRPLSLHARISLNKILFSVRGTEG